MSDRAEFERYCRNTWAGLSDHEFSLSLEFPGKYEDDDWQVRWEIWRAARDQGVSVPMKRIAQKKLEQMGATVHGVLVKNEAGAWAAVSEAGRVMWLDGFDGNAAKAGGDNAS